MPHEPWYQAGLRFSCSACGRCCENHGEYAYVYLMPVEVDRIAAHLGLERKEFLNRYTESQDGWTVLSTTSPACPFLGPDRRCTIYPVRPKQCATWPFWKENLEREVWSGAVREICPGIDQGELHSAQEVERIALENEAWYEDE